MRQIAFYFSILIPLLSNNLLAATPTTDEKILINYKIQTVRFSKSGSGEITAKLKVKEKITSLSSLGKSVGRYVFFDEFSSVENTKKNGKKYDAPTSDYEIDGIFHSDAKICAITHYFDTDGESVIIEYEKIFKDFKFIDKLYLDDVYPVQYATINIHVPDWLELNKLEWNVKGLELTREEEVKKKETIYSYLLDDIPQRTKYPNQPSSAKTSPHLILIPQSITKDGKVTTLMKSSDDLYKWYHEVTSEIGNNTSELESLVAEITASASTEEEKVRSIYYWIQDNIRYLAFEAGMMGFRPEACQDVLSNKYGDCKGMANLTKEMLTIAGSDARLTWLGTSDLPYDYSIPSLVVDNHMICTVLLDGKEVYLDATEKYADLYSNAYRIQGKEVMIEDGDKYYIKEIPKSKIEDSHEKQRIDLSIVDDQLVGQGTLEFTGERKVWLLNNLASITSKNRSEAMQSYINNSDKNVTTSLTTELDEFTRDKDVELEYNITIDNKIINLANELYINLETDYTLKNYAVEDRDKPINLYYPYFVDAQTNLAIPEGYKLTYTPEPVIVNHSKFDFNLSYEIKDSKILYTKNIKIKDPILLLSDFKKWDEAINKLTTFYEDQIIIAKQ